MIIANGVLSLKLTFALRPTNNIDIRIYDNINQTYMSEKNQTLTSVKIDTDLFENFKIECIKRKFSFQKLAERAMHLYVTDDEFKKQIHNHNDLSLESEE
jgi:hypothetical protein